MTAVSYPTCVFLTVTPYQRVQVHIPWPQIMMFDRIPLAGAQKILRVANGGTSASTLNEVQYLSVSMAVFERGL